MRGAVLAGGDARRFGGRPKGLEEVGGKRVLDRVVAAVEDATGRSPLLIANDPAAQSWRPDLEVIPDQETGRGALGGIHTAVTAGEGPVLVVAWDMPFVSAALLGELVRGSAPFDVYLPESAGPRLMEPLCAVYAPACATPIEESFTRDDLSAVSFHGSVRIGVMPMKAVSAFGDPERMFFNLNEPADLERARALHGA